MKQYINQIIDKVLEISIICMIVMIAIVYKRNHIYEMMHK